MEGDFLPVGFKERFAVASLSVLDIGLAGFGIVDDVLLQSGDFYQPLFGGFQLFVNSVEVCGKKSSLTPKLKLQISVLHLPPETMSCFQSDKKQRQSQQK